jgi:hypothetical protein
VFSFMLRPLYPKGNSPWRTLNKRLGVPRNRCGRREETILDQNGTRTLARLLSNKCPVALPNVPFWLFLRVRGGGLWEPVALRFNLAACSVFWQSTACHFHGYNTNVYCGTHQTPFFCTKRTLFIRILLWLPVVHSASARKSILPSFRKLCQCYCDCEAGRKGWGSKGHELFPVIFTMVGRKGKFAWGYKAVDARTGERGRCAALTVRRGGGEGKGRRDDFKVV